MHSNLSAAPGAPAQDGPRSWRSMALAALGGPVALGAIVGLEVGPVAALLKSLALPAVLAGVAAVMVPALYISAAITGVAPPARDMLRSMVRGFRACGLVMLGLGAPALFLLATTQTSEAAMVVGGGVTVAGALVGLRVLFTDLFEDGTLAARGTLAAHGAFAARGAFAAWSLVALIMGMRLYVEFVA